MALIKYNPSVLSPLATRFNDIFEELFDDSASTNGKFSPVLDVSETDKHFEISVALPGVKREDIQIELDKTRLTISGERKFEEKTEGKKFHRVESMYGSFFRSIYLPDTINSDKIEATFNDGILEISIEKTESAIKKSITIK